MSLSKEEVSQYDRQIRVWGADGQKKLGSSRVLLVGSGALGGEVGKNLVLGGIGTVHVADCTQAPVAESTGGHFFLRDDDQVEVRAAAVAKHLQELNALVKVEISSFDVVAADVRALAGSYDAVVWCGSVFGQEKAIEVQEAFAMAGKAFCGCECFGLGAVALESPGVPSSIEEAMVTHRRSSPALAALAMSLAGDSGALRDALAQARGADFAKAACESAALRGVEFAPTCSVIAGFLAQEMIKYLCGKQVDVAGLLAFHAHDNIARAFDLKAAKPRAPPAQSDTSSSDVVVLD